MIPTFNFSDFPPPFVPFIRARFLYVLFLLSVVPLKINDSFHSNTPSSCYPAISFPYRLPCGILFSRPLPESLHSICIRCFLYVCHIQRPPFISVLFPSLLPPDICTEVSIALFSSSLTSHVDSSLRVVLLFCSKVR